MEPGVPAWTPGIICASWTKLRPLSGRSTILRSIDDGADRGRLGLQQGGGGFTLTVSVTSPTLRMKSTRAVCWTCKRDAFHA